MKFTIKGHKNVLSTHTNTIEFTKDAELTTKGDCIVGVEATFDSDDVKTLLKHAKAKCSITAGEHRDSFTFEVNKGFDHPSQLVIRRSDFMDKRTLGIRSTKTAKDLNKDIIEYLKDPKHIATVEIESDD
jgi:hypothetical protein